MPANADAYAHIILLHIILANICRFSGFRMECRTPSAGARPWATMKDAAASPQLGLDCQNRCISHSIMKMSLIGGTGM